MYTKLHNIKFYCIVCQLYNTLVPRKKNRFYIFCKVTSFFLNTQE